MLRIFIDKLPLIRAGQTWSRCVYYLQISSNRTFSKNTNSEFNEGNSRFSENNENVKNINQRLAPKPDTQKKVISKEPTSKSMDRNPEELYRRYFLRPDQPENPHLLRVAIIGAPNSGKSTLINTLTGWKLNSVSAKVHTTRQNANTMFTMENTQIIFVDTPGVLSRKEKNRHYCEGKMLSEPQRGVEEADVVGVVVDVSSKWTRNQLHNEILKVLYLHRDVPSFLILNKIDILRNHHLTRQQRLLLDVTRCLTDGKVGGKKFGRSKIERLGQKKPDKLFELLEQKYGALKNKRLKNVSKSSHKKIEIDSSQDLATQFSEITKTEVSKYLTTWLQVDFKARGKDAIKVDRSTKSEPVRQIEKDVVEGIHKEEYDSEAVQKKMLGIFNQFHKIDETEDLSEQEMSSADVELDVDDTGELIDSSSEIGDLMDNSSNTGELKNDSLDTSELKNNSSEDYANVVMSSALKEEVGETENVNTVKGEDLDSEVENKLEGTYLITECELSELETGEFSEDKSDSEIVKNEFEESYQSEFLTRILSRPHEFSTDEDEARKDEEQRRDKLEISEEVEELKKAIEAVKDKYGWPRFDAVFPICALDGQGIDSLKDYLFKMSKPGDWIFHSSVITDQHPWDLAKQCVIQSFLDHVEGYMPYTFRPEIVYWDVDEHNRLNVSMEIFVSNKFEMRIILGKSESRISSITAGARQALMDTFQCEVRFKLAIRVHKKRGSK